MTSARPSPGRVKLADSQRHGPGTELLLVEGDSALASVCAVRQEETQAVLAFQGKPLNAWTATPARVDAHAQYKLLAEALGLRNATQTLDAASLSALRYERVALLFDPDADGIHIGALLVLYVQRWLPGLIEQGRLVMLRAPMFELVAEESGEVMYADHPQQSQHMVQLLMQANGGKAPRIQAHRGLGSISPHVLRERCVDPSTRQGRVVTDADVRATVSVFGDQTRSN
jgi:DNA gyrase subunit B